jgi:hypothetical protein
MHMNVFIWETKEGDSYADVIARKIEPFMAGPVSQMGRTPSVCGAR